MVKFGEASLVIRAMRRFPVFVLLLCFFVISAPGKGKALELGLTPSHVFGLWQNINFAFLELQKVHNPGISLDQVRALKAASFKGKRPADVFQKARALWPHLKATNKLDAMPSTPAWILDYQRLEGDLEQRTVTPSQVFVLSSHILNALVDAIAKETNGKQAISQFYDLKDFKDKDPSDVFGVVDLLYRRLKLVEAMNVPNKGGK